MANDRNPIASAPPSKPAAPGRVVFFETEEESPLPPPLPATPPPLPVSPPPLPATPPPLPVSSSPSLRPVPVAPPSRRSGNMVMAALVLAVGMVSAAYILRSPPAPAPNASPVGPSPAPTQPATPTSKPIASPAEIPPLAVSETPSRERRGVLELAPEVLLSCATIPAGRFGMGSPVDEAGRGEDETRHEVVLSRPFLLGVSEVTQAQYEAVMGENPSTFKGAERPVENVSWNDALEFCRRASQRTGRRVRLPTEAEWEYACRAGTDTPFHTGATLTPEQANFTAAADSRGATAESGRFVPNGWGLFGMHGNVQEWCLDFYGPYPAGSVTDPQGPAAGDGRVLRGGGWRHSAEKLRSARRGESPPEGRGRDIGFRVLVEEEQGRTP